MAGVQAIRGRLIPAAESRSPPVRRMRSAQGAAGVGVEQVQLILGHTQG